MGKKMKHMHTIKIPLFPSTVCVWFSVEQYEEDTGDKGFPRTAGAATWPHPDGADIVFGKYTVEYAAHEAVHAAWACLSAVGVKSNVGNQEPLAYLVGHITEKLVLEHMKWERKQNDKKQDLSTSCEKPPQPQLPTKDVPSISPGKGTDWSE